MDLSDVAEGYLREKPFLDGGEFARPRATYRFTKVPDRILEVLARSDLSSLELKIVLVVLRFSLGFNRAHCDRLSLRGVARRCDRAWGRTFKAAIDRLVGRGVITVDVISQPGRRPSARIWLMDPKAWRLDSGGDEATGTGDDGATMTDPRGHDDVPVHVPPTGVIQLTRPVVASSSNGVQGLEVGGDATTLDRQEKEQYSDSHNPGVDLRSPPAAEASHAIDDGDERRTYSDEDLRELSTLIRSLRAPEGEWYHR